MTRDRLSLPFTFDRILQLPPVEKGKGSAKRDFCFLAECWSDLFRPEDHFELSTVFRTAEERLVNMLEEVRYGRPSNQTVQLLQSLSRPLTMPEGLEVSDITRHWW